MKQYHTCYSNGSKTENVTEHHYRQMAGQETDIMNIYPDITYQQFRGFGGAFTEAAGYVYAQLSEEKQQALIDGYFGSDGLGYVFGRAAIDSCDFGLGNYSAVTDPEDQELRTFSLARDEQYVLPLLRDAKAKEQKLQLMLSPWSPPAFMKTNGAKNGGGSLKPEYRQMWTDYLCRYIQEYRQKGFPVFAVSVQNEPNAVQTWDSCVYTPEDEKIFIRDYLGPALKKNGLDDIVLTIWDHNKERIYDRTAYICQEKEVNEMVGAVGYHWYSGDHFEGVNLVREQYPDKVLIFTEGCIEYSKFKADAELQNAQMYAHEIIGSLNAGMQIFLDWNLCLTKEGGPNHVNNLCDALVMADLETGTLTVNLSYDYIGHFSRFIKPGAKRLAVTRYTDKLEMTAFENTDGSIVSVILNRTNEKFDFYIRKDDKYCPVHLEANSIVTLVE